MKSFSWTLALRYLNPLRTFVSIITLISLLGVAFGVMVLIVVLSVHNGFERNLKATLLGFSPHVSVFSREGAIENWGEMEEKLGAHPECESAYAFVEGYALLDNKLWQQPVAFRAVNGGNQAQIDGLTKLLDPDYPGSRADLGLDPHVVISRQLAEALGLNVGEEIRLLASSNLDAVMEVYNVPKERAWDLYPEVFTTFENEIREGFSDSDEGESAPTELVTKAYRGLESLLPARDGSTEGQAMRKAERELILEALSVIEVPEESREGSDYFERGTSVKVLELLRELEGFDLKEADSQAFHEIEDFVKPKTLKVIGVYHDTQRSQGPGVFVSLEIGQELKGLKGSVEGIALITSDANQAREIAKRVQGTLGDEWVARSWMDTNADLFELMKTEKVMMSFALSFITVLSAFSIMAVMYTVTVQKRQEIGVMKALGARPVQIVKVFLYQGVIVGIGGAILGLGLGLLALENREHIASLLRSFGVDPYPSTVHGMTELPKHVEPNQVIVICVVAVILCILAALVPALMAAFRDPAKSLRNL